MQSGWWVDPLAVGAADPEPAAMPASIGPSLPVFLVRALECYIARASTTINGDKCP